MIVPRVQGEPASVQEHFVPGTEIHGSRIDGYADVAEVTGAITRRNVHAAREGDCEMGEVPADAATFLVSLRGGAIASRVMVAELDSVVSVVADRLRPLPSA